MEILSGLPKGKKFLSFTEGRPFQRRLRETGLLLKGPKRKVIFFHLVRPT